MLAQWPFLDGEPDLDLSVREAAEQLNDLLGRETFFRELAEIDRLRKALEVEYDRRFAGALAEESGGVPARPGATS